MKIEDLKAEEVKKLKALLYRSFSFMFSNKKEFINCYDQIVENDKDKMFDSIEKIRENISTNIKDIIIEDILTNGSIYYIERYIAFSFSKTNNFGRNGLKDALIKITNFILNLDCVIPYEMVESLTKENKILQYLISNYIEETDFFILEEDLINHSNFYLRNMLFCYCKEHNIQISPRIKLRKEVAKSYNLGTDSYEIFHKQIQDIKKLSNEKLEKLIQQAQQNDKKARNEIITAYMPFLKILATYHSVKNVDYMDLFQEGVFGLIKAIEKYNPEEGNFIHYSSVWMRSYMQNYISKQERHVDIPYGIAEEEIPILEQNYENALALSITPMDSIEDQIEKNDLVHIFEKLLQIENLTERERKVLIEIYGLNQTKERLFKEIGEDLNCSRQRVDQLHVRALNKIRRAEESDNLLLYCYNPDRSLKVLQKVRQSPTSKNRKNITIDET